MRNKRAVTNLHSIYLTREERDARNVPVRIENNLNSFQNIYPGWKYQLFTNEQANLFLREYFDRDTWESFQKLVPLAYKADLLRYCMIYQLGGLYSDLSLMHVAPIIPDDYSIECFVFRDALNGPTIISNSLIYARPRSPIFEAAISKINENVRRRDYGSNDLCPTGPVMLGKLVARFFRPNVMRCGEVKKVTNSAGTTHLYYDDTERLIAVKHKKSQGLSELGGSHDAYGHHYKLRRVYGESKMHVRASAENDFEPWKFDGCNVSDGKLNFSGSGSFPVYGPYVNVTPGRYKISGKFTTIDQSGSLLLNLSAGAGRYDIATQKIESLGFTYHIDIPCNLEDFEVRLMTKGCSYFVMDDLGLEEL